MENLKKTCLHDRHEAMGALMSPFAGWHMPIQYAGIEEEHNAVRQSCGVFDVSHMGEVMVSGADAEAFVNEIFTNDVSGMSDGKILYGMMLLPDGGVIDDLLVYKIASDTFLLVINAGNIDKDIAWIRARAEGRDVAIDDLCESAAQLAVQGPLSASVMADVLGIGCDGLEFYTFDVREHDGEKILVSRTGYTGEDGFEIYASPRLIAAMWDKLTASDRCVPCGLGCRDTLRFEAGLPLYGDELTELTTPLEAGLGMFVKLDKPSFTGRDALLKQKAEGLQRKLVGLDLLGPGIARHGYQVLDPDGNEIGTVTTGYRSISLGKSIAMAMVDSRFAAVGTQLQVQIRRKTVPAVVIKKRFYQPKYKK